MFDEDYCDEEFNAAEEKKGIQYHKPTGRVSLNDVDRMTYTRY